jgi:hypothetical protein
MDDGAVRGADRGPVCAKAVLELLESRIAPLSRLMHAPNRGLPKAVVPPLGLNGLRSEALLAKILDALHLIVYSCTLYASPCLADYPVSNVGPITEF